MVENLSVGMKLHAKFTDGEFYPGEVVAISKSNKRSKAPVGVRFKGYEDSPLTWCGLANLKSKALPKAAQGKPAKGDAKAKAKGKAKAKAKAKASERVFDYSKLEKGTRLQAKSEDGKWYPAQVVTVSKKGGDKPVKVNWVGYTAASDEWHGADTLRSKLITSSAPVGKDTHVTIVPYFTVPDGKMEEFKAGFPDFYKGTKRGTAECLYYNFAISGNQVHCREGYKSAAGVLAHLGDVKASLDKAVGIVGEGGLKLAVMGPKGELEKLKEALTPLGCEFWETDRGCMWFGRNGGKRGVDTHVTIAPYFTVPEEKLADFRKGFPGFYKGTKGGTKKALYYGFAVNGNKVFCREGYQDAEGALAHVGEVKASLDKAVEMCGEGGLNLNLMGPAEELEKCKEAFGPLGCVFWETDAGGMWFGSRKPERPIRADTQVTLCPTFTVPDGKMDDFKANFADFYKNTKKGTKSCLYYGFAIAGNQVFCRESYKDAAGVLAHLGDCKEPLDKAVGMVGEGGLKLQCMGPAAELEKLKEALTPLGCQFFESAEGSMWFGKKGGLPGKKDTHVTICPYFTVPDGKMDEFKAGFPGFYAGTKAGTRECLYYGFCQSTACQHCSGNIVFCREGYRSAAGVLAHLGDVKAELDAAVGIVGKDGLKLAVMGPAEECEKLKEAMGPLGTVFWETDAGSFWK